MLNFSKLKYLFFVIYNLPILDENMFLHKRHTIFLSKLLLISFCVILFTKTVDIPEELLNENDIVPDHLDNNGLNNII